MGVCGLVELVRCCCLSVIVCAARVCCVWLLVVFYLCCLALLSCGCCGALLHSDFCLLRYPNLLTNLSDLLHATCVVVCLKSNAR